MGDDKIIIEQTPPNMNSFPRQDFVKEDFESLIYQKGYLVYHERAILCPCKSKITDNQSNCQNCGGSGWLFLDKIQTRMLLFNLNLDTKYKEWSEEKLGTVKISCSDKDQISFMDKITLVDSDSIHKQIIYPILYNNTLFSYLNYFVKEVLNCYLFINSNQKLKKLTIKDSDFSVQDNIFILNKKYYKGEDNLIAISITYRHSNTYHVLDTPRDIINSFIVNESTGKEEPVKLPLSGVGRKAHYVLDPSKFNKSYILDNT